MVPLLGIFYFHIPTGCPGRASGEPPRELVNLKLAPGSTWQPFYRNENHHGQRNRTPKVAAPRLLAYALMRSATTFILLNKLYYLKWTNSPKYIEFL
jgi:hypothetical protein